MANITNKDYEKISHDEKCIKITYSTGYSSGVMILKESLWILRMKHFTKAFKDCLINTEPVSIDDLNEMELNISGRRYSR